MASGAQLTAPYSVTVSTISGTASGTVARYAWYSQKSEKLWWVASTRSAR